MTLKDEFFAPLTIFGAVITLWLKPKKGHAEFFVQHGPEEFGIKN